MRKLERATKAGRTYLNPVPTQVGGPGMMFKVLPLYLRNREETEPKQQLGPFHTDSAVYAREPESGLRVTWFGHSSLLVELDGVRLLIDPVWDERASPLSFMGPKRFFPPTLPLNMLPKPDAVILSHDHYDHLGRTTVKRLAKLWPEMRWLCPPGVGAVLHGFGVREGRVEELDWTQSTTVAGRELGATLQVTAVPARHFSGRTPWNRFHTLWASYVLAGPKHKVYYGADTGEWDGFEAVAGGYGPFDLTMLEIGAFNELWSEIHLGPDGAARAFGRLGGGMLMPIHWGLFNLALHAWRQPIERLEVLAGQQGIKLFAPTPGIPTEWAEGREVRSDWWKKP